MLNLRPRTLDQYIGQKNIIKTLKMFIDAAKNRKLPSEHLLFFGPAGIGKTTLAHVVANELSGDIKITSGAAIEKSGDLAAILTNLKDNDVLFIDEIHRLRKPIEEILYPVLEEYILDIVIGKGPSARTVRLDIPKITIIGATTKVALLSAPLRDRFGLVLRLDHYTEEEMKKIIARSSKVLELPISPEAIQAIAKRSRRVPRVANRILKRARDVFEVKKNKIIDINLVNDLFDMLQMDKLGLTMIDLKYLRLLGEEFNNVPTGLETLSAALSEDDKTVKDFIEPYLLQIGFIKKTSRGRALTPKALFHLKIRLKKQSSLFNK